MKTKLRTVTIDDVVYKWHCSSPCEDYGAVIVRAWRGKQLLFRLWVHPSWGEVITSRFVAAQIKNPNPKRYSFEGYRGGAAT